MSEFKCALVPDEWLLPAGSRGAVTASTLCGPQKRINRPAGSLSLFQ
ncbi:hypothetical protein [Flavonifractor plautii]|nr:hypothetical protein [Flavonifractor plautii]